MSFVGIVVSVNRFAVFLEQLDDLFGFFLGNARIIAALKDQQRRFDLVNECDGRGGVINGAIFYRIAEEALLVLLKHGIGMFEHGHPIDDAEEFDGSGPDVGSFADGHEGHESAVGTAGDADLFWVDVAGGFKKFDGVNLILKIAAAEVFVIRFLEIDAVSGGSADIGSDADVPARNESSDARAPVIGGLPGGSAVRKDQSGIGLIAFEVERNPEQRADRFAVERFVADDVRRRSAARNSNWR